MTAGRSEPKGAERPRTAPAWVKIAVALHVFAITVWALPNPPEEVMQGKVKFYPRVWPLYVNAKYLKTLNPVKAYLFATGTWQYWDMFAPNPSSTDWYGSAQVEYRDGTKREVSYPRMYDLPIPEKFVKERYRKFYERAHDDNKPILFPAFGQRIAVLAYQGPKNPPVVVRLIRHWREVAGPGQKQAESYGAYNYYSYVVDQRWLNKEMAGR